MRLDLLTLTSTLLLFYSCSSGETPDVLTGGNNQTASGSGGFSQATSGASGIGTGGFNNNDASFDGRSGIGGSSGVDGNSGVGSRGGIDTQADACGNGIIDPGELCDGTNLDGATCQSMGLGRGLLSCDLNCKYVVNGCSGSDLDAGDSGSVFDDYLCDIGIYDPNRPPQNLVLSGSLAAHDPTMIEADGIFYRFQTGRSIAVLTSTDLTDWTSVGTVWGSSVPSWIGTTNLWAPDIIYMGGQYHIYYSASSFGSNESCIAHATLASLTSGSWQDQGSIICSTRSDSFNAIDPDVSFDRDGTPWMSFGSFWAGIMLIELDLDGNRVGTGIENVARGPDRDGEGSFIVRRCGYYYLFVSWGLCCPGAAGRSVNDLTYNIHVGRSRSIHGPYVDRDDVPMLEGGGTLVVQGDGGASYYAAGHGEWILVDDTAYIIYHAYPGPFNQSELRIAELVWDDEGWPVRVGP